MNAIIVLADGFETLEALTPFDLLKRSGIKVLLASIDKVKTVKSSHNLIVETDVFLKDIDYKDIDIFILPGGMPGAKNLQQNDLVVKISNKIAKDSKKVLASICASPSYVLGFNNIANDKKMTCYPGCEKVSNRKFEKDKVIVDGNLITAKGAGCALQWTYKIIEKVKGKDEVDKIKESIMGV